jgi:hypothetical protein
MRGVSPGLNHGFGVLRCWPWLMKPEITEIFKIVAQNNRIMFNTSNIDPENYFSKLWKCSDSFSVQSTVLFLKFLLSVRTMLLLIAFHALCRVC